MSAHHPDIKRRGGNHCLAPLFAMTPFLYQVVMTRPAFADLVFMATLAYYKRTWPIVRYYRSTKQYLAANGWLG
ncbi:hypothetical protein FHS21_002816 [Phyllobacterium trifolii]|uniref:Uncharacterized protein n=1 Tax=Phyllobacterium trifolii TaxID=300193 RepID=A0A839UCJ1_9HYPH|nr:hypothetical protein [Phyllobacterium trifolii]MBB3146401.1 hypothetical protein [Phyllobacterium trifolii]